MKQTGVKMSVLSKFANTSHKVQNLSQNSCQIKDQAEVKNHLNINLRLEYRNLLPEP